ncbi:protein kinase domain-containing protein [Neorhodopirellula pilleata]|uniref:Serine/threonine-protein kinase PknB n=1 Tax=Neorhodopirellula pilleata TaxID=2714738 RepID=A0A5C5ZK77_9BACT|nr:serine/threonine-protein kinase [Neorhodopirellula pilleata]TWT87819.1 Serine/threonine-protein kinase PknB [Neorhodopirellula pilleata]
MKLSDLPARELARLDAVCLDFESKLRDSLQSSRASTDPTGSADPTPRLDAKATSIDIDSLVNRYGGEHAALLRTELQAIRAEVESELAGRHAVTEVIAASSENARPLTTPRSPATAVSDSELIADGLPALGTKMGPYLLTSVLGRGGMGIVYRATDTRLDRSVAIKMLSIGGHQSTSLVERFQREAKAVAGLSHPHIVELFDVGVFEGLPYAVMEHLRGKTLFEYLRNNAASRGEGNRSVDPQQARRWGLQLAQALATAHQSGVIHRDLKPENVMVIATSLSSGAVAPAGGSLKLFDFGLSRIGQARTEPQLTEFEGLTNPARPRSMSELIAAERGSGDQRTSASSSQGDTSRSPSVDSATRVGAILGTPGYMAPEQARGGLITPATDVFALGCVLYEVMFGRPAFEGSTATQRFTAVLEDDPIPDPMRRRDDPELTELILRMLAKDPTRRPTAPEVVKCLTVDDVSTFSGRKPPRSERRTNATRGEFVISRRRLIEMGVGAIVGGGLGVTIWPRGSAGQLARIRSIGVLSFQEAGSVASRSGSVSDSSVTPTPAGGRDFDTGELLSGLLVNELSRIDGFTVPKFVPMTASLPAEFQAAAKLLEVDAIVTGTYTLAAPPNDSTSPESRSILKVTLEIVSGKTGKLIEALTVATSAGGNLIEQSVLAHRLADLVGQELTSNPDTENLNQPEAFTCLIKGRVRSDPDSVEGLSMALKCFEHAISVDFNYAQAHAGLGLTAITLASRASGARVGELIALSQDATARALSLDADNPDAILSRAMLDYQVLGDFGVADESLDRLTRRFPSHWQIQHQGGWMKMIQFAEAEGIQLLRRASGLHPASRFLKVDVARADWFRGYPSRALQAAMEMLRSETSQSGQTFARGLLIDLYEQSEDFAAAAKIDPDLPWRSNDEPSGYYAARETRLHDLPYGPFGAALNAAILQIRRKDLTVREPADQLLSRLAAAQLPMLPIVLCKHPALSSMTLLEQAIERFPMLRIG